MNLLTWFSNLIRLNRIATQQGQLMATMDDVSGLVDQINGVVGNIDAAVKTLQQDIKNLLAGVGTPAATQGQVDALFTKLQGSVAAAQAAFADAADPLAPADGAATEATAV